MNKFLLFFILSVMTSAFNFYDASAATVYLSDLSWVSATCGWSTVQKDKSINQTPITIGKTVYAKGLGVHALSDIVYKLNKSYTTFSSDYGIDTEVNGQGSSVFKVFVNDSLAFASALIKGNMGARKLTVNVDGKDSMKLEVTTGGDNYNNDDGDWGGAMLTLKSSTAATAPKNADVAVHDIRITAGKKLNYSLDKPVNVGIAVYDMNGRIVRSFFVNSQMPGKHSVALVDGTGCLTGVFVVAFTFGEHSELRTMISGLR